MKRRKTRRLLLPAAIAFAILHSMTRTSSGLRTLFIVPPRMSLLNRDSAATQVVPLVGLASIIGNIKSEFPETAFIDAFAEKLSFKQTLKKIEEFKPDVLAFSCLTIQINDAAEVAEAAKAGGNPIVTVVGGPHASRVPMDALAEFPAFDYAVAGEGELTMAELLRLVAGGSPASGVKGVYSISPDGVRAGEPRSFIDDLDSLSLPDWSAFNLDVYCASFRLKSQRIRELCVSINRGCPFNCIFCSKIMGNKVRKRSIPGVIDEIQRDIRDFGAGQILFTDETFTVDREGVVSLCEAMISSGISDKISWTADTRPDMVDDELVALMKRSGCFFLCFGADSTDDDALKIMKKNARAANIYTAIRMCKAHGLQTQAAYILGLPTDTAQSVRKNVSGALKVNSDFATFSILVPYPGTKVMEMAESGNEGLTLLTKDWRLYGKQLGYAMETKNLDRRKLEKLQRNAYFRYYLRPAKIRNVFRIADVKMVFFYFVSHMLKRLGVKPGARLGGGPAAQ